MKTDQNAILGKKQHVHIEPYIIRCHEASMRLCMVIRANWVSTFKKDYYISQSSFKVAEIAAGAGWTS